MPPAPSYPSPNAAQIGQGTMQYYTNRQLTTDELLSAELSRETSGPGINDGSSNGVHHGQSMVLGSSNGVFTSFSLKLFQRRSEQPLQIGRLVSVLDRGFCLLWNGSPVNLSVAASFFVANNPFYGHTKKAFLPFDSLALFEPNIALST